MKFELDTTDGRARRGRLRYHFVAPFSLQVFHL